MRRVRSVRPSASCCVHIVSARGFSGIASRTRPHERQRHSALERGIRRYPRRDTVALLAEALLLSGEDRRAFERAASGRVVDVHSVAVSSDTRADRLPLFQTAFFGREREVADIFALICDHRLVTVIGSGGIGKTRTTLQAATRFGGRYREGIHFVELAPVACGDHIASTIGHVVGEGDVGNQDVALVNLVRAMADREMLIVVDNCEHLIDSAASVIAALMLGCPQVTVLASSRQPLDVAGEHMYRLDPLPVPAPSHVGQIGASEAADFAAVELFVNRARAADHRFALTESNAPIVPEIVRRLDGLPLAIELAASRVRTFGLAELRDRLDRRFRLLVGGPRERAPRQQTLRAAIDWSYELLDARERALFRTLGVFVAGFTIDGAVAIAGEHFGLEDDDVFDTLASLVDKSLIAVDVGSAEQRYAFLESTRAFAIEKLGEFGEIEQTRSRHLAYVIELFASHNRRFDSVEGTVEPPQRTFSQELENVRASISFADRVDLPKQGKLLAAIGLHPWLTLGLVDEYAAYLEAFLARSTKESARERALLAIHLALIRRVAGSFDRARELAESALRDARTSDVETLALCLVDFAWIVFNFDVDAAEAAYAEASTMRIPRSKTFERNRLAVD